MVSHLTSMTLEILEDMGRQGGGFEDEGRTFAFAFQANNGPQQSTRRDEIGRLQRF